MASTKKITLIDDETVTATANGSTFSVDGTDTKPVIHVVVGTVTGTSPTLDIDIEVSADGTNWLLLDEPAQLTTTNDTETIPFKLIEAGTNGGQLMPYIRATKTIGGTDTPTFNNTTVFILVEN